ncbi:MAG TPA: hypothetical protein VF170_07625 [Planctomycetaceae bacterium]
MQVVLEVDPATEARVRESAAKGERDEVLRLLGRPLERAVDRLMKPTADRPPLSPEEVERRLEELDRLAEETARELGPGHRPLPPEALTREGIYGDHP